MKDVGLPLMLDPCREQDVLFLVLEEDFRFTGVRDFAQRIVEASSSGGHDSQTYKFWVGG